MNIQSRARSIGTISALACAAALAAQTCVHAEQIDPTGQARFTCSNPDVIARFVASSFPQDVAILQRAFRDEVCRYADGGLPVEPVRFVARVAAGEQAMEPFGYVWALRGPDGKITYGYFWKREHEAMRKRLHTFSKA